MNEFHQDPIVSVLAVFHFILKPHMLMTMAYSLTRDMIIFLRLILSCKLLVQRVYVKFYGFFSFSSFFFFLTIEEHKERDLCIFLSLQPGFGLGGPEKELGWYFHETCGFLGEISQQFHYNKI